MKTLPKASCNPAEERMGLERAKTSTRKGKKSTYIDKSLQGRNIRIFTMYNGGDDVASLQLLRSQVRRCRGQRRR